MENYIHRVNYYETDAMGITHHSNYVRWMEEARIDRLDKLGYGYKRLEENGIASPVLGYSCKIKKSTHFDDRVEICVKVKEYNSVRLTVEYDMRAEGKQVASGESIHCFVNSSGRPLRMNIECPEFDEILKGELAKNK